MEGQKEQNGRTGQKEHVRLEFESCSKNEEFARVVAAVFMSRLDPTLEETQDVKTAVSEAVTNAIIHGYGKEAGEIFMDMTADPAEKTLTVCITDTGAGIADVKKPWSLCIQQIQQGNALVWAFPLWKPSWMKLL